MEVAALGLRVDGADGIDRAASALDRLTKASGSADKAAQGVRKVGQEAKKSSPEVQGFTARAAQLVNEFGRVRAMLVGAAAVMGGAATMMVGGFARAAQEIDNLSRISGASPREFQRMAAASKMVGIEQNKLADQLRDFQERVGEFASTGAGEMTDFFEQIAPKVGLTIKSFQGLSGPEGLQLYYNALEQAGLSQQQMSFYLENMASDTTNLIPILKNGGAAIREIGDRAERYGVVMSDGAIAASRQFSANLQIMQMAMEGARNRLVEAILPAMVTFSSVMVAAVDAVFAFGAKVGPVFSDIAQYADIALVALAGFYAPALIGGIATLAKALAVGLVGAVRAVTAAMMANPIGLIAAALTAAAYAAYKFRDDIKQAIGVDVVALAKSAANAVIGSFVAAYENIKFVWNNFGNMLGAAVLGGVNAAIRAINELVKEAASGIDGLIGAINSIPMLNLNIGKIGDVAEIPMFKNKPEDNVYKAAKEWDERLRKAFSTDYLGDLFKDFKLPELGLFGGGGSGRFNPPIDPGDLEEAAKAAMKNTQAIDAMAESLLLAGLNGEELAAAQARLSLNQYATPEQIQSMDDLARAAYRVKDAMSRRQKFGETGEEADEYILGDTDPLSGGMFDSQFARYEAEAEAERERYQGQLDRLKEARELQIQTIRSYDELELQAAQQHADRMAQIDQAKKMVALSSASDMFGSITDIMRNAGKEQSGIYKAMFLAQKAAAIAQAIISTEEGAAKALGMGPFGIPLSTLIRVSGYASVAAIAAQTIQGMAHDGIDSVPQTGTWLLEKGERVTTAKTSARLDSVLERIDARQRGGNQQGSVVSSAPIINVIEDASRAGQVESTQNADGQYSSTVFVSNIFSGGEEAMALESAYGLRRVGR